MRDEIPDQTAMLLTEQEWNDLAYMCEVYRLQFESHPAFTSDPDTKRRLSLAARIKDATGGDVW